MGPFGSGSAAEKIPQLRTRLQTLLNVPQGVGLRVFLPCDLAGQLFERLTLYHGIVIRTHRGCQSEQLAEQLALQTFNEAFQFSAPAGVAQLP